jgi:hypothetical protein
MRVQNQESQKATSLSRVTYSTGLSRPVNRPHRNESGLASTAASFREDSQKPRFRASPRLAVRAAVSLATFFILGVQGTEARGRCKIFLASCTGVEPRHQGHCIGQAKSDSCEFPHRADNCQATRKVDLRAQPNPTQPHTRTYHPEAS